MKKERPSWDEYFMSIALLTATRASCKYIKAGAIIVKDKRIIATGYNGAPPGIENCLSVGCRKNREGISFEQKGTGNCRGEHAERNALLQISRERTINSTIYSVLFPCSNCAKEIVGAGVKEVVYWEIYEEPNSLTRELFNEGEVKLRKIDLNINEINNYLKIFRRKKYVRNKRTP